MKPAAVFNLVAAILAFVAVLFALLANYPKVGVWKTRTDSFTYDGVGGYTYEIKGYLREISYGFWKTCLKEEYGGEPHKTYNEDSHFKSWCVSWKGTFYSL